MNGEPIGVSEIEELADAQVFYAGMKTWLAGPQGAGAAVLDVLGGCSRSRGFGDFWGTYPGGARSRRGHDRARAEHLGLRRASRSWWRKPGAG